MHWIYFGLCSRYIVPEIWLNYGISDVVLDIRAENLEQNIDSAGSNLEDAGLSEKMLAGLDLSVPMELVVLHNSKNTQKIISTLYTLCEQKSLPFPKILADKKILGRVKSGLPEGSMISEFGDANLSNSRLVFVAEIELDGLFGFETISTRLLRQFGQENMLAAYAKRNGNLPAPGHPSKSIGEAKTFVDNFEITGIEITANSKGIVDVSIGHPAQTMAAAKSLESVAIRDIERQRAVIISTGKDASNDTLGRSLSSLWNCHGGIKAGGLAVLLAECGGGLGSDAIRAFIEGRPGVDKLINPVRYVDGMENLLYLAEIQKTFQIGLVSVLPDLYVKKLNMVPLNGAKHALDHIFKVHGPRQKVSIVSDGSRTLLR